MPSFMGSLKRRSSLWSKKASRSELSLAPSVKNPIQTTINPLDLPDVPSLESGINPSPDSNTPDPSDVDSSESRDYAASIGQAARPRPVSNSRRSSTGNRMSMISNARARFFRPKSNKFYKTMHPSPLTLIVQARSNSNPRLNDPMAPRITSFPDCSVTSQKLLLLKGRIGDGYEQVRKCRGSIYVFNESTGAPAMEFPINEAHFKILVLLKAGKNVLRLEYSQRTSAASLHSQNAGTKRHVSFFCVNNIPPNNSPPLHMAILLAKDSPGTFDAPPHKVEKEGNNLEVAVRKMRVAALLWQAFVAEQMRRHGFSQRTFRFEEEWAPGTVLESVKGMTSEIKIHVIRLPQTMAEIRDLNIAQQHGPATDKDKLHSIAVNACKEYFHPPAGCTQHVAAMFLDSHWDSQSKVITGHAALGGAGSDIAVGIFGSHALHAYPTCLENVLAAFHDATQTDTNYVANDGGRSSTSWQAANVGLAAHLHEVGHVLGLPHVDHGIMAADYHHFNRTFCVTENFRRDVGERCGPVINDDQESSFHRLSALRLRYHECLGRTDERIIPTDSIQVIALDASVWITSGNGIAWAEFYDADKDDNCKHFIEYLDPTAAGTKAQLELHFPREIRAELNGELQRARRIRVEIFSVGGSKHVIQDWDQMISESPFKIPSKKTKAYRSKKLGHGSLQGSTKDELVFKSFGDYKKLMNNIIIYHGDMVDGLEFCYEDGTTQLFGKRGGQPGGTSFPLNTRNGETLFGFVVRAGAWIDGISIMTTAGRSSPMFGNANGGSQHRIAPPPGYTLVGVSGSCGPWLDSFQAIISR